MNFKWTDEKIHQYVSDKSDGYKVLNITRNYDGRGKIRLTIMCNIGHVYEINFDGFQKGKGCSECCRDNITEQHVTKYIKDKGCKLRSQYKGNPREHLLIECACGNEYSASFNSFKYNKKTTCNECTKLKMSKRFRLSRDEVAEKIRELSNGSVEMLSKEYINGKTPILLKCSCGNEYWVKYIDFLGNKQYQCPPCGALKRIETKPFSYDYIKDYFEQNGYTLLSKKYSKSDEMLLARCPEGHKYKTTFNNFRSGHRCRTCFFNSISREGSYYWKGGVSDTASYLRRGLTEWKKASMKASHYRCVLTGGKFSAIHHLRSFDLLMNEMMSILEMPFKERIKDYTKEELEKMTATLVELHDKYSLGVCLCEYAHTRFHQIFGRGGNTPEQFEEFKQRWNNGEFSKQAGD